MSVMFRLEFLSVKDPKFREAMEEATMEELRQSFDLPAISRHTKKCCLIYAELRRRRRSMAMQGTPSAQ